MRSVNFTPAVLCAAGLTLLCGSAKAADVVTFAAAGSSAQFINFTTAFLDQGYANHYSTGSSSSFQIVDPGAPNENAQVAIYWQGSPGNYQIAVFYQVDSAVGVRAYFNSDRVTAPTSAAGLPGGANLGFPVAVYPNTTARDVVPPDEVLQAVNGMTVNVGVTDITPEDARVATERTINLGYSAVNPVKSAVNAASTALPVRFSLGARPFDLLAIGAAPILVFTNNNAGSAFASASGANLNIDSFTLAGFLSGQLNRTSDLILASGAAQNPVHTYIGEPLSGTYNTMEYTNPESLAKLRFTNGRQSGSTGASGGQELNVSATANNPLNEPATGAPNGVGGAGRIRVVGDVERIKAVANDPVDALGYAFWSIGNFTAQANIRYLTVDGVDPLFDNYTGGSLIGVGSTGPPFITFRNVRNGGYPLWSVQRIIVPQDRSITLANIVAQVRDEGSGQENFSAMALRVFRSYHQTPFTVGAVSNGNNDTLANGGDVGGAVFTVNNDLDTFNDFGSELTNFRQ